MAATVTINKPPSGPIPLTPTDYTAEGTANALGGANIMAVGAQIDGGGIAQIWPPLGGAPAPNVNWTYAIGPSQCSTVGEWYTLTIYAWDSQADCTYKSVTFQRSC